MEASQQFLGAAVIVLDRLGLDLGGSEAVRDVKGAQGVLILLEKAAAEDGRAEDLRRMNGELAAQQFLAEVFVAGKLDGHEAAAGAGGDVVNDVARAALRIRGGGVLNFAIDVTAALEIVADVAAAFGEQILVHGAFLEDGDELLEAAGGELDADDLEFDGGAGGDFQVDGSGVLRGVVIAGAGGNARGIEAALEKPVANALRALFQAGGGERLMRLEPGGMNEIGGRIGGGVCDGQLAEPGARADLDADGDVYEMGIGAALEKGSKAGVVETVGAEDLLETVEAAIEVAPAEGFAEDEPQGAEGLRV